MHNGVVAGFMQLRRRLLAELSDAAYNAVQSFHSDSSVRCLRRCTAWLGLAGLGLGTLHRVWLDCQPLCDCWLPSPALPNHPAPPRHPSLPAALPCS